MQADVGDSLQVKAMFELIQQTVGRIELLVNNSGVQTWSTLVDLREDDWDRTIRTNLKGCFLCMQQAARIMISDGQGGSIVNIGSGSNKAPFPNLIDYCASKGGIENLTKVVAVELGPHKIRVNCVAPGAIEIERTQLEAPDYAKTWSPLTPLRRSGKSVRSANRNLCLLQCGNELLARKTSQHTVKDNFSSSASQGRGLDRTAPPSEPAQKKMPPRLIGAECCLPHYGFHDGTPPSFRIRVAISVARRFSLAQVRAALQNPSLPCSSSCAAADLIGRPPRSPITIQSASAATAPVRSPGGLPNTKIAASRACSAGQVLTERLPSARIEGMQ